MSTTRAWQARTALVGAMVVAATGLTPVTHAGAADLREFYEQRPTWSRCATDGPVATLECAELVVPLDYRAPDRERIVVTMSRLRSADPKRGVLFVNPGGPGGSGLTTPLLFADGPLAKSYDLIGFDPRGVGRSTGLFCERTNYVGKYSSRPSDADLAGWAADAKADELGCQRAAGGLRPFVNTPNTARDMDVMRGVLGAEKLNYLGFSYGTYLGAVYGSLFGRHLDRSVLDSSIHPDWIWHKQALARTWATMRNVEKWTEWIGDRNRTYGLGAGAGAVRETVEAIAARLASAPVVGLSRTEFDAAVGQNARYRRAWDTGARWLAELARNKPADSPDTADAAAAARAFAGLTIEEVRNGVFDTVTCETDWPGELDGYYQDMRGFRDGFPYGEGVFNAAPTTCTFRSFTPPDRVTDLGRGEYPTGLVVQADGDAQTEYAGGPAMAARLNAHLISVPDDGTHGLYLSNVCVRKVVERYLLDSVLPATRVTCPGDPRPAVKDDYSSDSAPEVVALGSLAEAARAFLDGKRRLTTPVA